jgi:UDP-N-acetyl-D-glucosamine dehydrogenase
VKHRLLHKLKQREALVAVVGVGYVGLPLALAFAESGLNVVGVDLDPAKVEALNSGVSHIPDVSDAALAKMVDADSLRGTTSFDELAGADAVIICVPTPLAKTRDPDLSAVISACDQVAARLHPGMAVVLESTTYPGTTEEVILPRLSAASSQNEGLKVGKDYFVAFSPERIDPGRTDYTVKTTPKVVGGTTPDCTEVAVALYETAIDTVVPVSSPKVAEMVKLLENTFRAVNIGLVNEVAIMCDHLDVDVWEVIDAASSKPFGYVPFYPGPGLGGHCIPIDPHYLSWKLRTLNYDARFIDLAAQINMGMPQYVVGKVSDALSRAGRPLNGSSVLLLGAAYKADVSDTRESPSLELISHLRAGGAKVAYNDPYVPRIDVDGVAMESVELTDEELEAADCVVIATNHSSYDWERIVEMSKLIMDTRNATGTLAVGRDNVVKL